MKSQFPGFSPAAIAFLRNLKKNNEREWFNARKEIFEAQVRLPTIELVTALHREMLDAIRDGKLDSIFDKRDTAETLASVKELDLQWTNAGSVHAEGSLTMQLRVTDGGASVAGARLTLRLARPDSPPYYAQVLTDARGSAEMSVQVDEKSLAESSVLVQASYDGRTATRKFQLRSAS